MATRIHPSSNELSHQRLERYFVHNADLITSMK